MSVAVCGPPFKSLNKMSQERIFAEIERSLDESSCVTSRALAAMTHSNIQRAQRYQDLSNLFKIPSCAYLLPPGAAVD